MPRSSARCRPHILLSRPRGPDLELDSFQTQGWCPLPPALLVGTEFESPLGVSWTTTSSRLAMVRGFRLNPRQLSLTLLRLSYLSSTLTF